jgi:hypothetical protein
MVQLRSYPHAWTRSPLQTSAFLHNAPHAIMFVRGPAITSAARNGDIRAAFWICGPTKADASASNLSPNALCFGMLCRLALGTADFCHGYSWHPRTLERFTPPRRDISRHLSFSCWDRLSPSCLLFWPRQLGGSRTNANRERWASVIETTP